MNNYSEAAWMGNFGSLFPSQTTWLHKPLVKVEPNVDEVDVTTNYYSTIYEQNVATGSGKTMSGEWIENQAFIYWLQSAIQKNVFSLLINNNKIPATTRGAEQVIIKLREVLELAIKLDGISEYQILDYKISPKQHNISIKFKAMLVNAISYVDGIVGEITT